MGNKEHIEIWRMNAFTHRPFSGNPAGVVLDGDDLTDQQMQAIAPQLNSVSETVYVCSSTEASADIRLRYFTPTTEVDLCGHATIAALFAMAASGRISGHTETQVIRAQTRVGVLDLGLEYVDDRLICASMTQPITDHQWPSAPQQAATVLGLESWAIRDDLPIACASTGIWTCYVPLVNLHALAAIAIDHEAIESLWPENTQLAGVYPFVITSGDRQSKQLKTQGRFFCPPQYGIPEDPVTGTASGALAAYLIKHGVLDVSGELEAHQGVEIGSPGRLHARQCSTGAIEIRGQAVAIFSGQLAL
ncbi:MAG: PhzF family phenazine biosynthesis protein [Halioglobus sp.]|jgi:PhzF family phenazine biosynthesis protein